VSPQVLKRLTRAPKRTNLAMEIRPLGPEAHYDREKLSEQGPGSRGNSQRCYLHSRLRVHPFGEISATFQSEFRENDSNGGAGLPIPNCEIEGASIVLVGSFNPAIFHPSWLASHDMIRIGTAEKAELQIVSPEVSSFQADWLAIQVTRDRFQVSTVDPRFFEPLRDLVLSVFAILEHTPIRQMGINRDMHFQSSPEIMNRFGDLLAPKPTWKKLFENPLLETLVMRGKREEQVFRVTIQPSMRVRPGIYVGTNEHFDVEAEQSAHKVLELLRTSWDESQRYSRRIGDQLISEVTA
jgi:hypothetical protein